MNLLNLFKKQPQLKRIIKIKRGTMRPEERDKLATLTGDIVIEVDSLDDIQVEGTTSEIVGDGTAEFLEPMTEHQYAEWIRDEEEGWGKVWDRLLRRDQ